MRPLRVPLRFLGDATDWLVGAMTDSSYGYLVKITVVAAVCLLGLLVFTAAVWVAFWIHPFAGLGVTAAVLVTLFVVAYTRS